MTAVFIINRGSIASDATCQWSDVAPGVLTANSTATVRDLWKGTELGSFKGSFTVRALLPHASMLVTVTPLQ